MAQGVKNPTRIHEDAGSIPGLTPCIQDSALPQAVVKVANAAWIGCGCGCGIGGGCGVGGSCGSSVTPSLGTSTGLGCGATKKTNKKHVQKEHRACGVFTGIRAAKTRLLGSFLKTIHKAPLWRRWNRDGGSGGRLEGVEMLGGGGGGKSANSKNGRYPFQLFIAEYQDVLLVSHGQPATNVVKP